MSTVPDGRRRRPRRALAAAIAIAAVAVGGTGLVGYERATATESISPVAVPLRATAAEVAVAASLQTAIATAAAAATTVDEAVPVESGAGLPEAPLPGADDQAPAQGERAIGSANETAYAPIKVATAARVRPAATARVVATIGTMTPEKTTNLVGVLSSRTGTDGKVWVRVRLPVLPNNTTGWVPRAALGGYGFVDTRLVVDRARLRMTLYKDGKQAFTARIGVGTAEAPTPAGTFYIRNQLKGFDSPFYGPVAFGTSGRSAVLTDWPGGGFIGIHGTNAPELLPGRVSHGCIRLTNRDILRLADLMGVGTPVTII